MYKKQGIQFLLDPEDTMGHYENIGQKKAVEFDKEDNDALNAALAELPHTVAINFALGKTNDYFNFRGCPWFYSTLFSTVGKYGSLSGAVRCYV